MTLTRREFTLSAVFPFLAAGQTQPKRLRRSESFFGIHFDLHPRDTDTALGRDVTEEMIERFLDRVQPDYVQYDYKGHVGFIGYPSRVSASAPVVKDSLAIWRRVTARRGVALYIHFSGVLDEQAVKDHPGWARIGPDRKPSTRETSTFSPYVDERMIPQLKEAIDKYDIDGAWVDGECWGTNPDYSEAAARAFREATGIEQVPTDPGEPGWLEFLDICRQRFRDYLKHYVDAIHTHRPGFQIASNWLYTTLVPERPTLPVDFISGDYLGNASISRARLEARYLSWVDKPWDLMAWGFQSARRNPVGPIHKSAVQLKQEAAVVLAQGGGFQVYYQPTRAGKLDDRHVGVMAELARFCRDRQRLCHQSKTVPEIGILFSKDTLYATAGKLFGGWGQALDAVQGMTDAFIENRLPVDVIPDWRLDKVATRYKCIVIPEWRAIGVQARDALLTFAHEGGRLLIAGAENTKLFADALQIRLIGEPSDQRAYIPGAEVFANVRGVWQDIEPTGAHVIETRYPTYDSTRAGKPAATLSPHGDGCIAAIYGPAGTVFAQTHAPETRHFIGRVIRQLYAPSVEVKGPPTIEVVRREKDGRQFIHLLNATSMQLASDYSAVDFVPPVGPLEVTLRMPHAPRRVTLEPGGDAIEGTYRNGAWTTTITHLHIHAILAWEA